MLRSDDIQGRLPRVLPDVPDDRRRIMAAVRHKHTGPELKVRSLLHRLGYRFTVNGKWNRTLPGKPDVVLPKWRTAIFVHGCFWHGHDACKKNVPPKTRTDFWLSKIRRNRERDADAQQKLEEMGWNALVIWECEVNSKKKIEAVADSIRRRLDDSLSGGA